MHQGFLFHLIKCMFHIRILYFDKQITIAMKALNTILDSKLRSQQMTARTWHDKVTTIHS